MDNTLYVAMTGAVSSLEQQTLYSNNLANANTTGFQADMYQAESVLLTGSELNSQAFSVAVDNGIDFQPGPLMTTNRSLDVAINGKGYFAIQDGNGKEAYTRAGNFQVNKGGFLTTADGHLVLGDGGPISIPPAQKIDVGNDGTITVVPEGSNPDSLAILDRLKLVNPNNKDLIKNTQGFLVLKSGGSAQVDAGVTLEVGALENSNVNAIEQMVNMINASREFEAHMKTMQTVDENQQSLARLLQF